MLKFKSERDALQKSVDLAYVNAITKSMDGLSRDYTSIDNNEKIQLYYKTLYYLESAINAFESTSYEEYNNLFYSLNNLYHYLIQNTNENYEIRNKGNIYEFLAKVVVSPEDNIRIDDFNKYFESQD